MAAETNLVKAEDLQKAREVVWIDHFTHDKLDKLIEALGVTRRVSLMEGTTIYAYEITGTLEDGNVAEGDIIPLSKFEQKKTPIGSATLFKWRKDVSAEAISKSGYNQAVIATDNVLMRKVQKGIRTNMFGFMNGEISGSTGVSGTLLQETLAKAWAQLQIKFEDDAAEPVYFLNPIDVSDYLASANITTQTAFGMNYVKDFLGLGTVIMNSSVTAGTLVATAKENIIMYYIPMTGDLGGAFNLTVDRLGLIGISSGNKNTERAVIESLVMSGIQFAPEYAEGVVKGTIGSP